MPEPFSKISKSTGQTPTEETLAQLCDRTFLKLWSYANPIKADGKELCDVIAVFENHVFVFFDRESKIFQTSTDVTLTWERWEREVIEKQIATANGAKRYILRQLGSIYLDARRTVSLPIRLNDKSIIHKIVVAHGAAEACKTFSSDNMSGSLAITYSDDGLDHTKFPFFVKLSRHDPVHVLDSHNLRIILEELDTVYDFVAYLSAKEAAIAQFETLTYCGEEDLLANYYRNYNAKAKAHFIGALGLKAKKINGIFIEEGAWESFKKAEPYQRKKRADRISYLWDDILQRTSQNALDGTLQGNSDIYNSRSAIFEMAKEPRFARRALSDGIKDAIRNFPYDRPGIVRHIRLMPSFYSHTAYVFLQLRCPDDIAGDYDTDYRPLRRGMLEVACGVARNKFPEMKKIIGIAIDAPKDRPQNSEDFILMEGEWGDEKKKLYEEANRELRFFETGEIQSGRVRVSNFPRPVRMPPRVKPGRNDLCPCGSGKKFKKCHGK